MRRVLTLSSVLFAAALLAAPSSAQVTGTPGLNDYTINSTASGSTSCNLVVVPFSSPITFAISGAPNTNFIAILLFSVPGAICPCTAGFNPLAANCAGIQSWDLPLGTVGCNMVLVFGTTDGAGNFSVTAASCPSGTRFSTQTVLLGPTACPPKVWTQAYDVTCL